jgi:hypothetical protein
VLVMVTIFMWRDFRDMAHYVSKRIAGRRDGDTVRGQNVCTCSTMLTSSSQMLERKHQ